jgi:hypothetical protein
MQDVFIAHDRADIGIAEAYARTLKKLGYEASWDAGGVVNDDWADRALATVKTARCVIALWSPRSVNSEYVNFWATSAAALGKLISVNAYGDAEPRVLHRFGTINLAGWDYATATPAAEQFLAALKKLTKKTPKRDRWMRNAPAPAAKPVLVKPAPAPVAASAPAPALAAASLPAPEEILAELPPLPADAVVSFAPSESERAPDTAPEAEPDLPPSLKKPRAKPQREPVRRDWLMWAGGALAAPVIAVGFFFLGSELREILDQRYTPTAARAQTTVAAVGPVTASAAPAAATARTNGPRRFAGEENLITLAELERYDWQAIAVRLDQRLGDAGATILQEKAATGDPAAKLELCVAHLQGIAGLSRAEAHAPCSASAQQAHPAGQFLAWMLRDRASIDYDDARRYLIAAADQGWAPAQRLLASFHRNRQESFTPDAARERALLSSAAAEGYPRAMFDYASLYLRRGSAEDRTLAQQYLQRVMDDREFGLCGQARRVLVQMGDEPPTCRR